MRGRLSLAAALLFASVSALQGQGAILGEWGHVIFEDSLSAGEPFDGSYCEVRHGDGGAIARVRPGVANCLFNPGSGVRVDDKYRIEINVRLRQAGASGTAGLGFALEAGRFLIFALDPAGQYLLASYASGSRLVLTSGRDDGIRSGRGATNHLAVEVNGRTIDAFINGRKVTSVEAPRTPGGGFGLFIAGAENEGVFSDLRARHLSGGARLDIDPLPGGRLLLESDLTTDERFAVGRSAYCDKTYADGGYSIEPLGGVTCHVHPYDRHLPVSVRVEVSVRPVSAAAEGMAGLKVGYRTMKEVAYGVWIRQDGRVGISAIKPDGTALLAQADGKARTGAGASNRLAVEIMERRIRVFINNQLAVDAQPGEPVQGAFGFVVHGSRAVFTNVRVLDFSAAETLVRAASGREPVAADAAAALRSTPTEAGTR